MHVSEAVSPPSGRAGFWAALSYPPPKILEIEIHRWGIKIRLCTCTYVHIRCSRRYIEHAIFDQRNKKRHQIIKFIFWNNISIVKHFQVHFTKWVLHGVKDKAIWIYLCFRSRVIIFSQGRTQINIKYLPVFLWDLVWAASPKSSPRLWNSFNY